MYVSIYTYTHTSIFFYQVA